MIPVHVAIVDKTNTVSPQDMALLAGALNSQIQNDVAPVWHVAATCGAYADVPPHTWGIVIEQSLDQPGALGYHTDANNQPISYIEMTPDYSVTCSHELLEMLVDPWGNRMHAALPPQGSNFSDFGLKDVNERVYYLLEVCDPCENSSYQTGGVLVSDFLTERWYRSSPVACAEYSHTGYCAQPRQVAEGGYVSFANTSGEWFQVFCVNGQLEKQDLGNFNKASFGGLREWVDQKAREHRAAHA
jgi:hypothetical protein